jgi:Protein of unknown function (DUF1553)/Protein of unknown function (DUF1549)/Planctomycete cytochrome C
MNQMLAILAALLFLSCGLGIACGDEKRVDFNRDIRPILGENCFFCHGPDARNRQADLRLDQRTNALESKVIVPGEADSSELIKRILSDDPDAQMPPSDSARHLSTRQKELLEQWIAEGAEYAEHWAFIAPTRPKVPEVANEFRVENPIDNFILEKLQVQKISQSPEADRRTLIKRLSIDLVGLPPTPAEVETFLNDRSPQAYENLVERLLASPHYGERMALPWLDAARYADSNGFQQDGDTWQWIWRDWVVRALNEDIPFDQFSIWQLAGDLLPNATEAQKIASAFNRNHLLNGEGGAISEEQRFVVLFDRMDTTATNWLGLTMACAQCHDHKYDPISQRDYYSLMDAFNRVPENGVPTFFSSRIRVDHPVLELPTPEYTARLAELQLRIDQAKEPADQAVELAFRSWKLGILTNPPLDDASKLPPRVSEILRIEEAARTPEVHQELGDGLRKWFDEKVRGGLLSAAPVWQAYTQAQKELADFKGDQLPRLMIMSDDRPRETHILNRGAYLSPMEKVEFSTPAFLPSLNAELPRNRLGLARWLFAEDHPLTARVQVNRMWQHFFGVGLVKTPEDFGVQSEYPLHRELLDWLAVEFRERKWSMKAMHRLIVTSATYRQSSRVTRTSYEKDPGNNYLSRANRFRMPAMLLRDWALASSETINLTIGGRPVYPYQPDGIWESLAITKERDFTYPASSGDDLYRRSLYSFWRRTVSPANMFDASNRQACRVRSSLTSTPLQSLTMLNDPTWVEAARALAEKTIKDHRSDTDRLTAVFERILCRSPSARELDVLRESYGNQLAGFTENPEEADKFLSVGARPRDPAVNSVEVAALAHICLGVFNLDEAMTRE